MPVSRPAVSQHLRVLREARLVSERKQGSRNLYSVDPRGIADLRSYLEGFWGDVLDSFKKEAKGKQRGKSMDRTTGLVVRKEVVVEAAPALAFEIFTERIGAWWPLRTHSVGQDRVINAVMEAGVGGRIYEVTDAGQSDWGVVTTWTPPHQVAFTWHPGRAPATQQLVEVTFAPEGSRTRVTLVHTGWETLGDEAEAAMRDYDKGWEPVLAQYANAARL